MSESTADLVGRIVDNLDPGAFVTKFIVLAEVIDTDGKTGVWSDSNCSRWDTYGLLTEALAKQQAQHMADALNGDD